jgi:signal transduction histidine kinase
MINKMGSWWNHLARADRWLLVGIMSAALLVSGVSSWGIFEAQSRERDRVFQGISKTVSERLALTVNGWIAQGESGRDLVQLSDGISSDNYWQFSQHLTETYPALIAVDYMPRVLDSERAAYERQRSAELGMDFTIREFDANGELVTASRRSEYYPVSDARLPGWDIATDPNIGQIIDPSRGHDDTAGVLIPSPLDEEEFRMVVAYPLFDSHELFSDDHGNPDSVVAFTLMAIGITPLVEQATADSSELVAVQVEGVVGDQSEILYSQISNDANNPSISRVVRILDTEWKVTTTLRSGVPGRWPDQFPAVISIVMFLFSIAVALAVSMIVSQRRDALSQAHELRNLSDSKSQFLTTVSHELKTPLTSVTAFTDLVLRNADSNLSDRQLDHLNIVRRNSQRLNVLIDDLLDVSRISAGKLRIEMNKFDALPGLRRLVVGLSPIFEAKNQKILSDSSETNLSIEGDRDRIEQVVSNLLSNASKYSPDGSEVVFRTKTTGGTVLISVQDKGIGISPEDMDRVFEPFFRANNAGTMKESGTGLGLFITKSIIEAHRGNIEMESTPVGGTTVTVSIPTQVDDLEEVASD